MTGSFLSRTFVMILGYAYPAYECYKTVELNKPEIEQLRFWCQYWILVALLTIFERLGDALISWLPMYSVAKFAFFVYLWYPKTKGTTYVYDNFFRPYVAKHETEIDRHLLELRTRAGDLAILYWQKSVNYGQRRFFEILQYVASQSKSEPQPRTHPVQQQQQQGHQTADLPQHEARKPPLPPSAPTRSKLQELARARNARSSSVPQTSSDSNPVDAKTAASHHKNEAQPMQVDIVSANAQQDDTNSPSKEKVTDEAIRRTRAKLRKRAAIAGPSTH